MRSLGMASEQASEQERGPLALFVCRPNERTSLLFLPLLLSSPHATGGRGRPLITAASAASFVEEDVLGKLSLQAAFLPFCDQNDDQTTVQKDELSTWLQSLRSHSDFVRV